MKIKHGIVAIFLACSARAGSPVISGSIHAHGGSATTKGLAGVTIELLSSNGTVVATSQTDIQGQFVFSNVVENAGVRLKASHAGCVVQMNGGR